MSEVARVPLPLAGRVRRLVATLIDAALVPSLTLLLVMITGVVEDAEDYVDRWGMLLSVFVLAVISYLILNGYGLWRRGQTLGKMLTGIAIVAAPVTDGEISELRAAPLWKLIGLRALFFPVLFMVVVPPLAALPILDQLCIFGKRRRCVHDLISGTIVVRLGQ